MSSKLHGLARRQARRVFGSQRDLPPEAARLLELVSDAYRQADDDRLMLERSLELSSEELYEANQALEERVRKRTADLEAAMRSAEESNQAKSRFLANMSHEIRTPLNGVLGMAQLLLRGERDPRRTQMLEILTTSAKSLISIIDEILDVSKIEAGKFQLESIPFSLREVSESTSNLYRAEARNAGLELVERFEADDLPALVGDPARLRQVLANLVSNALKFTKRGTVTLHMRCLGVEDARASISLEVADTGVGIEPQALERVFERFNQADTSTTRRYGGTGLGLAISKQIVEMMGGTIEASSEVGVGTRFDVRLELPLYTDLEVATPRAPEPPAEDGGLSARILVAEDNEVNQIVARGMLESLGCRVDIAPDGRAAVEMSDAGEYDLILMDCHMPEMDGWQATVTIRARAGAAGRIPVVAMTATAAAEERQRCTAVGMDEYISKPVDLDELRAVIRAHCGEAPAGDGDELAPGS